MTQREARPPKRRERYAIPPWLAVWALLLSMACATLPHAPPEEAPPPTPTGGTTTGPLRVERVELTFGGGLTTATISPGAPLHAVAVIRLSGNGPFRARWEVDGRTIEVVNRLVTGGATLTLPLGESPGLPTFEPGPHEVRLRILAPASDLPEPTLRYFVAPEGAGVEAAPRLRATLHLRPVGAVGYREIDLPVAPDGRVSVVIPEAALVPPGVEYYLELRFPDGRRATDPADDPVAHPHRLAVAPPPAPHLTLAGGDRPRDPGEPLHLVYAAPGEAPADPASLRLFLDDLDVTGVVTWEATGPTFRPTVPLAPGNHLLTVVREGAPLAPPVAEIPFTVEATSEAGGELYARGSLSLQYSLNTTADGPADRLVGNLGLAFGGSYRGTELTWNGINLNYAKGAEEPFTLSSGFSFTARRGEQLLEYGDLSVSETPLTVGGLGRRGAQLKLKGWGGELHLFNVRSEAVTGFESGLSTDLDHQVVGGSLSRDLLVGGRLHLKLVALTGGNEAVAGSATASTAAPTRGDTVGMQVDSAWGSTTLTGEVAWSRFDADTGDGAPGETDTALTVGISQALGAAHLRGRYLRYGSDYATIADPNFTGDREGIDLGADGRLGPATLSLALRHTTDNVSGRPDRPVVTSNSADLGVGLALAALPAVQLGYGIALQDSADEPPGSTGVNNAHHTLRLGLTHGGDGWNTTLSANLARLDDRSAANADAWTRSLALSGAVNGERATLAPSLSYDESESGGTTQKTALTALNLSLPVGESLQLSSQASYQKSWATDDSVETERLNGSVRLSWNVKPVVERWLRLHYGSQQLAVSIDFNDSRDGISDTGTSDLSAFLSLSFSGPIDLRGGGSGR